ncbi:MAG TPA: type VI secretion system protein TssA [Rhodothermales bacterium]|nr:type VI secretion system protein TssA [Rhodothermales bacterium]
MAEVEVQDVAQEQELSAFALGLIAPISPGSPCGQDVTYDDDFQRMKAVIDSVSSATTSGDGPDYQLVIDLGKSVLAGKSKDLRVACYLTLGLERMQGLSGLADGLVVIDELTRRYWEDVFPPKRRMTGRQNALQSLSDNLKDRVSAIKPTASDGPIVEQALSRAKALQAYCLEVMAEQAPALSGLVQSLEAVQRRASKPAPSAGPAVPSGGNGAASVSAARVPSSTLAAASSADELTPALAERTVLRCADFLREKNAEDPVPYRLVRCYWWSALRQEPVNEGGKTRLEGPPSQRSTYLNGLLERGESAKLVSEAEGSFHEYRFWLDTQRLAVSAMERLGDPYRAAREGILFETALLLKRVPGLIRLTFSDGTPFADAATQAWIETQVQPVLEAEARGGPASHGGDSQVEEQYKEARQQAAKGDLAKAMALMQACAGSSTTAADRFRARLYLAALCISGGKPNLALPLLERLDEEIAAHRLDDWDPHLALEVWSMLHRCYVSDAKKSPEAANRAGHVFQKICRVDVQRAMTLQI